MSTVLTVLPHRLLLRISPIRPTRPIRQIRRTPRKSELPTTEDSAPRSASNPGAPKGQQENSPGQRRVREPPPWVAPHKNIFLFLCCSAPPRRRTAKEKAQKGRPPQTARPNTLRKTTSPVFRGTKILHIRSPLRSTRECKERGRSA